MMFRVLGVPVDVRGAGDVGLLVSCLDAWPVTDAMVEAAKRAAQREREADGLICDAEGRIVGELERHRTDTIPEMPG